MTTIYTHELIQSYFDKLYSEHEDEIKKSLLSHSNETYGEIYYYSVTKLLPYLDLSNTDHFLDIGSGLGKLVFQLFLTTSVASVTGIEINHERHKVAEKIKLDIEKQLSYPFREKRTLNLLHGDFLQSNFSTITVVYICSTIFSYDLLSALGTKLNAMTNLQKIVSLRKLPNLENFKLIKKLFVHCTWDNVPCYLYERKF